MYMYYELWSFFLLLKHIDTSHFNMIFFFFLHLIVINTTHKKLNKQKNITDNRFVCFKNTMHFNSQVGQVFFFLWEEPGLEKDNLVPKILRPEPSMDRYFFSSFVVTLLSGVTFVCLVVSPSTPQELDQVNL